MKYQLTVIQYPSGRFGFVGSVPSHLAYVGPNGEALESAEIERQLRLPAKYRTMKTRTWATKEEAEAANV